MDKQDQNPNIQQPHPGQAPSPHTIVQKAPGTQPAASAPTHPAGFPGHDGGFEDDGEPREEAGSFTQFIRSATATRDLDSPDSILPHQPRTLVDVGLSKAFLTDLALKIIHYSGTPSLAQLIRRLGLGPTVVQQMVTILTEERLIEVLSQSDLYTGNYRYRLSERGSERVSQALERSRYAGPAPVTAEQYSEAMRRLHAHKQEFSRARIKSLLNELVLSGDVSDAVARALFSGKATLFYGPSGNGKTSVLERYASDMDGLSIVPYAIYAYGQTIRVFDQSIHQPLEELDNSNMTRDDSKLDRRWVLIQRPAIVLGAEMGREALDMAYDPQARFYQAPPHIKAQGGVLVVDDFGRQKMDARDLLTRLLIPLERGVDTLALATGEKLTVPFSEQLLFATNIPIKRLADDSLLRRILYKVEVTHPQPLEFTEILRRLCRQKHVLVSDGALEYAVQRIYNEPRLKPRASYGRDLLEMLIEGAQFDGIEPVLDTASFERVLKLFVAQEADEEPAD
ncbi:MAG: hypothetical protein E6J42_00970 [Chloroflexi bacterium]|nr:MAG: hypothetical protein E6J42_00970 [Chloroflexota bacterium]